MSENTDTPITDEFERATCDGLESALEHARDLERQLAEAISRAEFAEKMGAAHLGTLTQCNIERHIALEELAEAREDVVLAAGELLLPIPEPGTDTARMMAANSIMRRQRDEAREQRDRLAEALRWLDRWMGEKPLLECANKVRTALSALNQTEQPLPNT